MASTDAKTLPVKNAALRITFPIFDADGDLVTGATGLDSEVSKDAGTFADCTNEATEIATSSGMYYLDLTSTEMNADTVAILVKTSTSGAKTTPIVLYTAARSVNDLAYPTTTGRSIDVTTTGEVGVDLDNAAGTLDAAQFGTDAFTAAKFAADVTTEFQAGLATAAGVSAVGAFVDTEVASILAAVDTEVAAIKAVTDALGATLADPTGEPAWPMAPGVALAYLAAWARNRVTQTATTTTLYRDDGTTAITARTVSDDGTTFTSGEAT